MYSEIENIFFVCCLITTIGLQIDCIHRYLKNDDSTEVIYTDFHSSEIAMYPSLSVCLREPFLEERFNSYGFGVNLTSYEKFLMGKYWDERMLGIAYDDVTAVLSENLIEIYSRNHKKDATKKNFNHHVSLRSAFQKCFTIDNSFSKKNYIFDSGLVVRQKFLQHGIESKNDTTVLFYLHYPGQRLTARKPIALSLRKKDPDNYLIKFKIKNVDIITRRNKWKDSCIENWREYDEQIKNKIMIDIKCRPPHWVSYSTLPICTNSEEMEKFSRISSLARNEYEYPCRSIARVDFDLMKPEKDYMKIKLSKYFPR